MTSGIERAMDRVRAVCLAFPNAVEDSLVDTGIRALSDGRVVGFKVSRRVFARMFVLDSGDREQLILWIRADPAEREFLLGSGHPYFRAGPREVGVVLDEATDWAEVPELITESYLIMAPTKLAAEVTAALRRSPDEAPAPNSGYPAVT